MRDADWEVSIYRGKLAEAATAREVIREVFGRIMQTDCLVMLEAQRDTEASN